jgi:hypothetical protein
MKNRRLFRSILELTEDEVLVWNDGTRTPLDWARLAAQLDLPDDRLRKVALEEGVLIWPEERIEHDQWVENETGELVRRRVQSPRDMDPDRLYELLTEGA